MCFSNTNGIYLHWYSAPKSHYIFTKFSSLGTDYKYIQKTDSINVDVHNCKENLTGIGNRSYIHEVEFIIS